ncbi:MAG TPA: PIN domain-containing protein [Candidatus Limnocylindrales bacterium]|nr:PIN domain-containing protein [Candidatus Limnocylindrales bacterium]
MNGPGSQPAGSPLSESSLAPSAASPNLGEALGREWDFWAIRLALFGSSIGLCLALRPFNVHGLPAAGFGFFIAMVVLLAELRLRHAEISGLVGGSIGVVLGLLVSLLITLVVSRTSESETAKSFIEFASLLSLGYLGLVIGTRRGREMRPLPFPEQASVASPGAPVSLMKLVDTSVLIDGRIADICETHFLDGSLGLPRFVLHELQMVADSSDALKRQRGRRGLEVLQRMQKMPGLEIRVLDDEVSGTSGVDQKLVELARRTGSKIVTNDYNLNKVARVQNIPVLNINELANALKPAVLPGESMRVLILREGKEPTQGVAYLDDGTMVVVDGARRLINRTVEIVVTSVHQTPAGKMIFGRLDERADSGSVRAAAATASASPAPRPENAIGGNGHAMRQPRSEASTGIEAPSSNPYPESETL